MHDRSSIFPFLRLFLSFELNLSPPLSRSGYISRRIRAITATGMCHYQHLPLPGHQNQQLCLSCIWETFNAGKRASKLSFKIFLDESYLLCMSIKRTLTWN